MSLNQPEEEGAEPALPPINGSPSFLKRWWVRVPAFLGLLMVGMTGTLGWSQRSLIYHPRPEPAGLVLPGDAVRVGWQTTDGQQWAVYLPPKGPGNQGPPERLWVVCSGNASLAVDWIPYMEESVRKAPGPLVRTGYLLVDYPGYGRCEGRPSEASIGRTMASVLEALTSQQGWSAESVRRDLRVLGFSLGSGAALKLAARETVRELVLLAPFRSLPHAARQVVGPYLTWMVVDQFDNEARLREILKRPEVPPLTIFHGSADTVIPFSHGEALVSLYGPRGRLIRVEGGDHRLQGEVHWNQITALLRGQGGKKD
jgi:pimeloyl-ACP methyl ester carboxylesterase